MEYYSYGVLYVYIYLELLTRPIQYGRCTVQRLRPEESVPATILVDL